MKIEQHNDYLAQYGDQYESRLFTVEPEDIVEWDQARLKGDNQVTYNVYLGQFLNGNKQLSPISVVPLGNGKYKCMDGTTRGKAKIVANKTVPQKTFISTFQHDVLKWVKEDWDDFQEIANDHIGGARSTDLDIEARIEERVKSGFCDSLYKRETGSKDALDLSDRESVEKFLEVVIRHISGLNRNAGKTNVWYKNRIEKFLYKYSTSRSGVKTYNDSELAKGYRDLGNTRWNGSSIKDDSGNEHLFVLRRYNNMNPNLYGALVNHIKEHPGIDFTILLNFTDVLKKGDSDIIDDRNAVVKATREVIKKIIKAGITRIVIKHSEQILSDKAGFTTLWDSASTATSNRVLQSV